jgi:hypothetical protein
VGMHDPGYELPRIHIPRTWVNSNCLRFLGTHSRALPLK